MATAVFDFGRGIFGDEMYTATDLNRRAGEVLNHARMAPVTISRNNEQFALLRREDAAGMVKAIASLTRVAELIGEMLKMSKGKPVSAHLNWLTAFDPDDLIKFCGEMTSAVHAANAGGDWDEVGAIIHEWHESGLLFLSGMIPFETEGDESNEIEIPDPRSLLDDRTEVALASHS